MSAEPTDWATAQRPYHGVPVLVLGASGFIGRWVARRLAAAGAHVTCAARDVDAMRQVAAAYAISGEIAAVDLAQDASVTALFEAARPVVTFNLAGYGIDRSERDEGMAHRINAELVGLVATLAAKSEALGWAGARLVHTGSALEYGTIGGSLPEDAAPAPTTLYGQTKLAGTRLLRDHPAQRSVTARLFTVYGPGEHAGRLLPCLLAARGSAATIALSVGTQRRDFTFVDDVAEGLLRLGACAAVPGGLVNLATGGLHSVRQFAETAAAVLGIAAERLDFGALPQRDDEMPHGAVSLDRLRQSIAWTPGTTIAEGVRRSATFPGEGIASSAPPVH